MSRIVYEMEVHREDPWWVGVVDGVPGAATETRRLSKLAAEMVDLLSGLLDLDPDDIQVESKYLFGVGADKVLNSYREAVDGLQIAKINYEYAQRKAVREFNDSGLSLRDSAELLGVSFQRVQQISAADR